MYSLEDKIKAVQLYIKYGKSAAAVIRELGYPNRHTSVCWYKEYVKTNGNLPMRHERQMPWIFVKLLLFVYRLGKRDPLGDIVYGGQKETDWRLGSNRTGEKHRQKNAPCAAALQKTKEQMKRDYEPDILERFNGERCDDAKHRVARAEADCREHREKWRDPVPVFKASKPGEGRKNLSNHEIHEKRRDAAEQSADDPQHLRYVGRTDGRKYPRDKKAPSTVEHRRWRPNAGSSSHFVPERRVEPTRRKDEVYQCKADACGSRENHIALTESVTFKKFLVHIHLPSTFTSPLLSHNYSFASMS